MQIVILLYCIAYKFILCLSEGPAKNYIWKVIEKIPAVNTVKDKYVVHHTYFAKVNGRGQILHPIPKHLNQSGYSFKCITYTSAQGVDVQNLVWINSAIMDLRRCVDFIGIFIYLSIYLSRWRGGATGRALDLQSTGSGFKSYTG